MKVALIHPLKHHAYHSLNGIKAYEKDVVGLFGYFKENDIIDRLVSLTSKKEFLKGYYSKEISENVISSKFCKILFLLYKFNPKLFSKVYFYFFEKWAIKYIKKNKVECIHVLQDYCNKVIRYAKENNIKIVYEQITVFVEKRIEILNQEVKKDYYSNTINKYEEDEEKIKKEKQNLKSADIVICASKMTKESLSEFNLNNLFVIPYGCYKNKKNKNWNGGKLHILYVGAISLRKGVHYIIEVAKLLKDYDIHFNFVGQEKDLVGTKEIKEIRNLNNCTYIGSIPNSKINEIYKKNDVFIFQTLSEGFGMVTLEAMSFGLPCITSNAGVGVVKNEYSGLINEECNIIQIRDNILKLYNDKSLLNNMSENAYRESRYFSWEKFESEISKIYNDYFAERKSNETKN